MRLCRAVQAIQRNPKAANTVINVALRIASDQSTLLTLAGRKSTQLKETAEPVDPRGKRPLRAVGPAANPQQLLGTSSGEPRSAHFPSQRLPSAVQSQAYMPPGEDGAERRSFRTSHEGHPPSHIDTTAAEAAATATAAPQQEVGPVPTGAHGGIIGTRKRVGGATSTDKRQRPEEPAADAEEEPPSKAPRRKKKPAQETTAAGPAPPHQDTEPAPRRARDAKRTLAKPPMESGASGRREIICLSSDDDGENEPPPPPPLPEKTKKIAPKRAERGGHGDRGGKTARVNAASAPSAPQPLLPQPAQKPAARNQQQQKQQKPAEQERVLGARQGPFAPGKSSAATVAPAPPVPAAPPGAVPAAAGPTAAKKAQPGPDDLLLRATGEKLMRFVFKSRRHEGIDLSDVLRDHITEVKKMLLSSSPDVTVR